MPIPTGQEPFGQYPQWAAHCFSCNESLDVFGFIEKAQSADFRGALSYLADRYGIPLNSRVLTESEKHEYAEARRIRAEAAYFADAVALMAEWALEELAPAAPERAAHTALLAALRVSPDSEYPAWLDRDPTWAAALVEAGRERERRLQAALARWIARGMSGVPDAA